MQYVIKTNLNKATWYFCLTQGNDDLCRRVIDAEHYLFPDEALSKIRDLKKAFPKESFSLKEIIDTTNII